MKQIIIPIKVLILCNQVERIIPINRTDNQSRTLTTVCDLMVENENEIYPFCSGLHYCAKFIFWGNSWFVKKRGEFVLDDTVYCVNGMPSKCVNVLIDVFY